MSEDALGWVSDVISTVPPQYLSVDANAAAFGTHLANRRSSYSLPLGATFADGLLWLAPFRDRFVSAQIATELGTVFLNQNGFLFARLRDQVGEYEVTLAHVDDARDWAFKTHADQKYGRRPYTFHLGKTVATLERFGLNEPELQIIAWLHDVIEDAEVTEVDINRRFGPKVAASVWAVTGLKALPRTERFEVVYRKLFNQPHGVVVKLADRIANVEASIADENSDALMKYMREYPRFRERLFCQDPRTDAMWAHLDRLLGDG